MKSRKKISLFLLAVSFLLVGSGCGGGSSYYYEYEWAESTGGDCNGNSDSFNEGCEEYYNQLEETEEEEYYDQEGYEYEY